MQEYKVCPRCRGTGTHDCWEGGMTEDQLAEQGPEFLEDYLGGMYSVKCTECDGKRVVFELDWYEWIDQVEELLGHSADGDNSDAAREAGTADGYSLDQFYDMWKASKTPEEAVATAPADHRPPGQRVGG